MLLRTFKNTKFQPFRESSTRHNNVYVSGIQPTGVAHLGNYFGFIKTWVHLQNGTNDASKFLAVVDLHAITTGLPPPSTLKNNIVRMTASLLACGVDPDKTVLFQQSQIPEHCQLSWILGSLQTITQLQRLPQYKDKSKKYTKGQVPLGLVSYPVLQSADVLLYKGTHVPVGEDQSQHMNLLSDIAERFNFEYKTEYFPIPQMVKSSAPRIRSLKDPLQKMSKSDSSEFSRIDLSDESDILLSKIKRGLTDTTSTISYDWENRPGVSNLVSIYSAFTNLSPEDVVKNCKDLDTLGFKKHLYEIAEETLAPIRNRFNELCNDEAYVWEILNKGSEKARNVAQKNLYEIKKLVGFSE
uniref:Tryptophan--tRNA ligase n=1 Tax=Panagrolaimus sp. ES5 TaxID=591445 RepID=A0AC34GQ90_9BILA